MRKHLLYYNTYNGNLFSVDITTDNRDPEVIYKSILEKDKRALHAICFLLKINKGGIIEQTVLVGDW